MNDHGFRFRIAAQASTARARGADFGRSSSTVGWTRLDEAAKIALPEATEHTLFLERIERGLACALTQAQLEAAGAQLVARVGQTVDGVIRDAGVRPDRIESTYLTGGASAMRALNACIAKRLPAARMATGDVFGGIGVGLAVVAARRYGMVSG